MLETLREYGLARLRDNGDEPELRRRHRDHYLELALQCDADWFGPDQLDWFARLHAEHDNLRAAMEYCLDRPDEALSGMTMATALWFYWMACGQLREGRHWLTRALECNGEPSRERARALAVCGYFLVLQADPVGGSALLELGRTLAKEIRDGCGYARASLGLAIASFHLGKVPEAQGLCEESLAAFDALTDPDSMAPLAILNWALFHAMGPDPRRGGELCEALRRSSEASGELWVLTWAHFGLANATWLAGRPEEAIEHARQCLRGKWRFADALGIAVTVELLAWITAAAGRYDRAAVLLGAAEQTFAHYGLPMFESAHFTGPHDVCEEECRAALGAEGFAVAFQRGGEFGIDEAIGYALTEEHAVSELVAEELSDRQVAPRLMIAEQQRDLADLMRREANEMSAIPDPDEVMDRLASTLMEVLSADAALLVRADATGRSTTGLTATAVGGAAMDAPARELANAESLADLIGSTASARASTDALPEPLASLAPGARCWLALPLTSRTQTPALLVVCSTTRAGYDEAQTKIGAALVGQGMLAYDNALLFQQVERLASLDGLSGLNNRRRFLQLAADQATVAPTQSRPMGVAMVDIDHFKDVNDTFGHAVGDEVIRVVASRIQENLRSDDIVGRYGGEEFAIVLPQVGIGVGLITERLREAVATTPITTAAGPIIVTVSIGTAVQENPEEDLEELLDRADRALDRAKEGGRNRVAHG